MNPKLSWKNRSSSPSRGFQSLNLGGRCQSSKLFFSLSPHCWEWSSPWVLPGSGGERGAPGSLARSLNLPGPLGSLPASAAAVVAAAASGRSFQRPLSGVPGSCSARRRPPPSQARGGKGAAPGSAEPRLLPVACPRLGVGVWWGRGRGRGKGRGRRRRQSPTCGREVGGCGAIEKEPARSSPKLVGTPGSRGRQELSGGGCLGDGSAGRTVNASPSSGCERAGRTPPPEPTAAGPSAAGTEDFPGRQEQPRERGRPAEGVTASPRWPGPHAASAPLPAGDRRRLRAARVPQLGRALSPSRDKLFPNPIQALGPNLWRVAFAGIGPRMSVHFSGEMSERKEGRGKGKGKKDRGSGKKPALPAGGQSPGECAARPGSAILFFPLRCRRLSLARPRPALQAPGAAPGRPRSREVLALGGAAPHLGAQPYPGDRTPRGGLGAVAATRALRGSGSRSAPCLGLFLAPGS